MNLKYIVFLFLLFLSCQTLQKSSFVLESSSSLEEVNYIQKIEKTEILKKERIFILVKKNFLNKEYSWFYEYLIKKQEIFLNELLNKNSHILFTSDQQNYDFLLENEYYANEESHSLVMIFRKKLLNETRKYFFNMKVKTPKTKVLSIYTNYKKIFISENILENYVSNFEEPSENEVLSFLNSVFYGKVHFYSNLPNVKVKCNQNFLGVLPITMELLAGKYECIFTSAEGISKYQKFYLSSQQELKIYQGFFESQRNFNLIIDAIPQVQRVKVNEVVYDKTPIVISIYDLKNISFQNFQNSLDFSNLDLSWKQSSNWLIFPYMIWDAFHPSFINFWEEPKTFGTSIEMNRYLSVINNTKSFLNEWSYLESKPFFPESILIEGSFFPIEDSGTGIFQFHFGTLRDYYTIEVEEERVSLFHFSTSKLSLGTYFYPITDEKKPREFSIQTEKELQTISIYLNGEKVLKKKISFNSTWKLVLSFKGRIFNRFNVLNHLKISYPRFLSPNDFQVWTESGYNR